jgi:Pyruvate/2-oxoacid:ferredoxin oxidoreductase delta subunit
VSRLAKPAVRVVLYEGAGSRPLGVEERVAILRALLEKGYGVSRLKDRPAVGVAPGSLLIVMGRFDGPPPRVEVPVADVRFHEIDGGGAEAAVETVERARGESQLEPPGTWKPWFPVIDYKRCTNCMQCLSFCLFDVYATSPEGKIQVRNQDNCKTDCPACSRVCPEVAIMFPKYRHGPINGEEVSADDVRREAMKVDISALLGGDIYAALRDRSAKAKSRFSKERDDDRALKERQNCLLKLQHEMGIPPEVLASLPSPEEIRAKAEAAVARAREASEKASSS